LTAERAAGQAKAVFESLDVSWDKPSAAAGRGKRADRKAGLETLFFEPEGEGSACRRTPALHVIQHIRDESHDHAISGHRKKRAKVKNTSTGDYRRRGAETSPDAAEVYGRIARITQRQHRRNCKSAGYFARSGRKDLLLVETLRAL
jgi:excinuclease ABC subunit C